MVDLLLQTSLNAIYAESFMALVAVGLVMIFGVMGVINFAHGELYMLGAYAVVAVYADLNLPFFLAVAVGLVFVGLVGIAMERTLFRPLRGNPLGGLVVSIGFLLILQTLAVVGFGVRMEHIPPPTQTILHVFGAVMPLQRLYVIVASVILLTALDIPAENTIRMGTSRLRAGPRSGRAAGHLHEPDGALGLVHRSFVSRRRGGVDGAFGAHLSLHGPFDHRHRIHHYYRRWHR